MDVWPFVPKSTVSSTDAEKLLKIAFRNLRREKEYALINVLRLAVGLAAVREAWQQFRPDRPFTVHLKSSHRL